MIDLRRDTLIVPTLEMRRAMRDAEVGDEGRINPRGEGEGLRLYLCQKRE